MWAKRKYLTEQLVDFIFPYGFESVFRGSVIFSEGFLNAKMDKWTIHICRQMHTYIDGENLHLALYEAIYKYAMHKCTKNDTLHWMWCRCTQYVCLCPVFSVNNSHKRSIFRNRTARSQLVSGVLFAFSQPVEKSVQQILLSFNYSCCYFSFVAHYIHRSMLCTWFS